MLLRKSLRMRRLSRDDDRTLAAAMDHAHVFDTVTGLKNSNAVLMTASATRDISIISSQPRSMPALCGTGIGRWILEGLFFGSTRPDASKPRFSIS